MNLYYFLAIIFKNKTKKCIKRFGYFNFDKKEWSELFFIILNLSQFYYLNKTKRIFEYIKTYYILSRNGIV